MIIYVIRVKKKEKIEAGDTCVSIDLQVKSLFALGVTRAELGETIKSSELVRV